MARYRFATRAQRDIAGILSTSLTRWGVEGRARYEALLTGAVRTIAADPYGPTTRDRLAVSASLRSFHTKHARGSHGVGTPVHVLYYRVVDANLIEIARVLHERIEPERHFAGPLKAPRRPRRASRC